MWYAVMVLAYIGIGQLLGVVIAKLTGTEPDEPRAAFIHSLVWWLLWPLGLVLVVGGAMGTVVANRVQDRREGHRLYSSEQIADLERELGLGSSNDDSKS